MNAIRDTFEDLYRRRRTLWTVKKPSKELVELVESGQVIPSKALDAGCGEGYFSIYLAKRGFDVTGVDWSETAISRAIQHARKEGVQCRFMVLDALNIKDLGEEFDFILEWGLMHSILPQDRQKYLTGLKTVLKQGGLYLSASFSWYDSALGDSSLKYRLAPESGLWLYYSTHAELKELFSRFFKIVDSKLISIMANNGYASVSNYFLMQNG